MSLVIAKKVADEVFIISDTKFTYKEPETNKDKWYSKAEEYLGGLKSVLLAPGLCVCFAGEVEFAKDAIENVLKNKVNLFNKNKAINYFLDSHLKSSQETDYIIVSNTGTLEIFKIANKKVECVDVAWIGDYKGFAKLQQIIQSNSKGKTIEEGKAELEIISLGNDSSKAVCDELSAYMHAFSEVIKDSNIDSIDGIRTLTRFTNSRAYYSEYVLVNGIPKETTSNNNGVYFGDSPEGTDSKHVGIHSVDDIGIFSLYYYSAKFGIIYNPIKSFIPEIHQATDIETFRSKVSKEVSNHHALMVNYQKDY